jgi:hypothetical protein
MSPIKTEVSSLWAWPPDTISAVKSSFQNYWPAKALKLLTYWPVTSFEMS